MIIYSSTKDLFRKDVASGLIDHIIHEKFREKLKRNTSEKEVESWWNSLHFMSSILEDSEIPNNTGIAIECQIPQTAKRIDFILSGLDKRNKPNLVIVELKQWKSAQLTEKDGIVRTALGKGLHETSHPSYQAYCYAELLEDFSETVSEENIILSPCAFLHNYEEDTVIRNPFYSSYLQKAPVFLKREGDKLQDFIKRFVHNGDNGDCIFRIDRGKIKPSKKLSESLSKLMQGKKEFVLVDDQKLVYETGLWLTQKAQSGSKKCLIVEGGPGTGKSVVAINLLVEITQRELLTQYVTKNAAPRAVYEAKLTGTLKQSRFNALFQGSGRYVDCLRNQFDTLIIDEAHRLNMKSGMFQNIGENQVKEIIEASKCSIFFIDEDQKVTFKDIGTKEEIKKQAILAGAEIIEMELSSQFRCNGSDGYLAFVDNLLQIKQTANTEIHDLDYEFKVFDNPTELRDAIFDKNEENNSARMVAGYCWDWKSKNNPAEMDIIIEPYNFRHKWNLAVDGSLWILSPKSVNEIGCIHTCQGLELDYIGVIIGEDLIVRNGKVLVDPAKRSKMDSSIKGYKKLLKDEPNLAKEKIRSIIKNTYRTLMTRGMKGCYVYSVDKETNEWLKAIGD